MSLPLHHSSLSLPFLKSPRSHSECFHSWPDSSLRPSSRNRRGTLSAWDRGDWLNTTRLPRHSCSANLSETPVWSRSFDNLHAVVEPGCKNLQQSMRDQGHVEQLPQDAQKGRPARPQRVNDRRRTLWGTLRIRTNARTLLADFFSILLKHTSFCPFFRRVL